MNPSEFAKFAEQWGLGIVILLILGVVGVQLAIKVLLPLGLPCIDRYWDHQGKRAEALEEAFRAQKLASDAVARLVLTLEDGNSKRSLKHREIMDEMKELILFIGTGPTARATRLPAAANSLEKPLGSVLVERNENCSVKAGSQRHGGLVVPPRSPKR